MYPSYSYGQDTTMMDQPHVAPDQYTPPPQLTVVPPSTSSFHLVGTVMQSTAVGCATEASQIQAPAPNTPVQNLPPSNAAAENLLAKIDDEAWFNWKQVKTVLISGGGFLVDAYDLFVISLLTNLIGRCAWILVFLDKVPSLRLFLCWDAADATIPM